MNSLLRYARTVYRNIRRFEFSRQSLFPPSSLVKGYVYKTSDIRGSFDILLQEHDNSLTSKRPEKEAQFKDDILTSTRMCASTRTHATFVITRQQDHGK
jgi:hypothetical protein